MADPHRPHPCDDDRKISRSCGLIDIIKQSLLVPDWEGQPGFGVIRVLDYDTSLNTGSTISRVPPVFT
jgi:hypothetical protein